MTDTKTNIYERVTNQIIELLEASKTPEFQKAWIDTSDSGPARNPVSHTTYSGVNQILLSMIKMARGANFNRWLTFKQVKSMSGKVRKGAKGAEIVYVNFQYFDEKGRKVPHSKVKGMNEKDLAAAGIDKVPFLRGYYVFNLEDVEGMPEEMYHKPKRQPLQDWEKDDRAETLINATGADIRYKEGNRAFYRPSEDYIQLPIREQFKGKEPFYETAFHELAHWTGAPHRLNRPKGKGFGSPEYAKEELTAELATAFICANLGFDSSIPNNAAYIDNWLQVLRNDQKFIFKVTGDAQRAANYIFEAQNTVKAAA